MIPNRYPVPYLIAAVPGRSYLSYEGGEGPESYKGSEGGEGGSLTL